jgi:hypothetical protein
MHAASVLIQNGGGEGPTWKEIYDYYSPICLPLCAGAAFLIPTVRFFTRRQTKREGDVERLMKHER